MILSPRNIISIEYNAPFDVFSEDIDGDGNIDVLCGDQNKIAWHKNDGHGNFSPIMIISTDVSDLRELEAIDLDRDGDLDVISASYEDNKLAWYENDGQGVFRLPIPH